MSMLILALFLIPPLVHALSNDYANQWLMECRATSEQDLTSIDELSNSEHVDIWNEHPTLDARIAIRVDELGRGEVEALRLDCQSTRLIEVPAVRAMLLKSIEKRKPIIDTSGDAFFDDYRRYDAMVGRLGSIENGETIKLVNIGRSIEGRDMYAVHLTLPLSGEQTAQDVKRSTNKACTGDPCKDSKACRPSKRLIWISAGQHAREWIAPASAMYLIDELAQGIKVGDPRILRVLTLFEIVVVPCVNPDGYEYSHTTDRMWRKNRRVNSGGSRGVDLNRNWDDYWGQRGASKSGGSDIYCGTHPSSEPEVRAMADYILSLKNRLIGIDVHSFGQLILRNFGTCPFPHSSSCRSDKATVSQGGGIEGTWGQDEFSDSGKDIRFL